jgi:hypothetical protein
MLVITYILSMPCIIFHLYLSIYLSFSSKPKAEQCLVRWATPQLHDINAVEKMADHALRGLYPPKSLFGFADIIALCVQVKLINYIC